MIHEIGFYFFSIILIFSACMVVFSKNPVQSVLFLILAFFNSAGLFLINDAEFIAFLMVIVYVGAVAVLFLFVVMMIDIKPKSLKHHFTDYKNFAFCIGGILLLEFFSVIFFWKDFFVNQASHQRFLSRELPIHAGQKIANTNLIGKYLYTDYILFFQISGFILLVALVGAICLTHQRRFAKRQNLIDQITRRPEDVLEVKKVSSHKGLS